MPLETIRWPKLAQNGGGDFMSKMKRLEWTLERACAEFGINPRTLSKNIKTAGIEPAFASGTFSTKQICQAVYGDLDSAKLKLVQAQARKAEVEAANAEKNNVPIAQVKKVWADYIIGCRALIANSELNENVRQDVTSSLAEIDVSEYFQDKVEAVEESNG